MAEGMMIPGLLGLEIPMHQVPQQQHRQMMLFPSHLQPADDDDARRVYSSGAGPAQVKPAPSPDDEPDLGGMKQAGAPSSSPWQRMKWTDAMVRLLIMVVYCVGDEGGADHQGNKQGGLAAGKKGGGSAAAAMQQQKKGKWKSVSRAMMEKGYYVSPQQCEDKFNDLNKRYKRVNDILGRGTACRVVENQALLDSMDHLSAKAREEARKLLNSKHLFFREMCAYHRSCADAAASSSLQHQLPQPPHAQACDAAASIQGSDAYSLHCQQQHRQADKAMGVDEEDEAVDDEEQDEDEEDQYYDEEEEEVEEAEEFVEQAPGSKSKRKRASLSAEALHLKGELAALTGPAEQQRQWLSWRAVELEERRVSSGRRAVELEKQRLKWLRYSGNKEREMERAKLENERLSLENERMLLLLRHKELELASSMALDHNDGHSASAA